MSKIVYTMVGCVSLLLGSIGIIIPLLPTTPFLLLASFCLLRGSDQIYNAFKGTKIYKKHLYHLIENKAMTKREKKIILVFSECLLFIACIAVKLPIIRIFIIILMLIKLYYFIFHIKTITE